MEEEVEIGIIIGMADTTITVGTVRVHGRMILVMKEIIKTGQMIHSAPTTTNNKDTMEVQRAIIIINAFNHTETVSRIICFSKF
jgi:hypothetical protein